MFSTLWIFKHQWWPPGIAAVVILITGFHAHSRRFHRSAGTALAVALLLAVIICLGIYLAGMAAID